MEGLALWVLVAAVGVSVPAWNIFTRAGFHPALSLLIFVPFVGPFIALLVLAFCRWPRLERER